MPSKATPKSKALPARERILETAHDLFYRDGIRATGIDRVIAKAGVTKVTFYRHFPSKNDLVLAFLDYRHGLWMRWFVDALQHHAGKKGKGGWPQAIVDAMAEWFAGKDFRGCAFINAAVELDETVPGVMEVTRRHKQDMADAIAQCLPAAPDRAEKASAIALAVDGAILRAQYADDASQALAPLQRLLKALA